MSIMKCNQCPAEWFGADAAEYLQKHMSALSASHQQNCCVCGKITTPAQKMICSDRCLEWFNNQYDE